MPTILIHEEVAYRIASKYKKLDNGEFYLGAMAPDSVNLNGFADKKERYFSHVRDTNLHIWLSNVEEFYRANKDLYPDDFLIGYVVHLLTDIIHDRDIYPRIQEVMRSDGILTSDQHRLISNSMMYYDYQCRSKPFFFHIKEKLKDVEGYSIRNIDKEEMLAWKNKCFEENSYLGERVQYITEEDIILLANKVEEEMQRICFHSKKSI